MKLALIVAHDEALVIGKDGALPWRLPADLKHFKETTMGKPILMGRGVFEELNERPLPGRENIVISAKKWDSIKSFTSPEEALAYLHNHDTVFVIGGAQLYASMMDLVDSMIVTEVPGIHEGDTFFPDYRPDIGRVWQEISRREADGLTFKEYRRKPKVAPNI